LVLWRAFDRYAIKCRVIATACQRVAVLGRGGRIALR
jgi:hypothetical protein